MPAADLRFGPFRFDAARRVLFRGSEIVPLTPKAAEVLALLIERQGQVVDKAELLRSVWPDTFVEEGSLTQNIFQLRKVVGNALIETVPRRGYRFVAPTVAASIAVLPFLNLTGEPEWEYFSDGLTDEIICALAAVPGLRVPARSSAFQFKGRAADIRMVGSVLNVAAILEGTVRRSGGLFKVTAQLSSAADGYCIWAENYARTMQDSLVLQTDIAGAILRSLKLTSAIPSPRHSANPRAYEMYLKGRFFWNQRPSGIERAVHCFEQALALDPGFALAYAGLADCYSTQSAWESGALAPNIGFPKAERLAVRAVELDEGLAEAHTTLGYVKLHYDLQFELAEKHMQRALSINAGYSVAHHWYSHILTAQGRNAESLEQSHKALALDPIDLVTNSHMAWHFYYAGEVDAMEEAVSVLEDLHPAAHWTHFFTGWLRERQGRTAEAVQAFERATAVSGGSPVMKTALAHALGQDRQYGAARALLAELESQAREQYVSPYELAVAHARLGDSEAAHRFMQQAIEGRSAWLAYLPHEPRFQATPLGAELRNVGRASGSTPA